MGKSSGPKTSPNSILTPLQIRLPIMAIGFIGFPTTRCHSPTGAPVFKDNGTEIFSIKSSASAKARTFPNGPSICLANLSKLVSSEVIWLITLSNCWTAWFISVCALLNSSSSGSSSVVPFGSAKNFIAVLVHSKGDE